jgi:hypothetical protein
MFEVTSFNILILGASKLIELSLMEIILKPPLSTITQNSGCMAQQHGLSLSTIYVFGPLDPFRM